MADLALPVLVSRVLGALTAELERETGDGVAPLAVWSNVLRCIDGGITEPELAPRARISKRLAISAVTSGARHGWLTATGDKRGKRDVALTSAGETSHAAWTARLYDLDEQWSGSALRTALEGLVSQLPFELAWYPATYGGADPSVVGGSFVRPKPGSDEPAHGVDWRPVRRADGDTVSDVPLTALLSQTLDALAIDYEARPAWPLSSTTLVVRHLRPTPSPLADVPGDHGITGQGKSLLERHGIATVTADPDQPRRKLVQLTELGEKVRSHHDAFVADVEERWRDRYGAAVVDALRDALEAHPAAFDAALPDHVVAPL